MANPNSNPGGQPITGTDGPDTLVPLDVTVAAHFNGGDGDDDITGSMAGDVVNAGDGWDTVMGAGGDDTLRGNDGTDTAVYAGSILDFLITPGRGNAWIIEDTNPDDGDEGADEVKQFEFLEFDDFVFAFDGNNAPLLQLADQSTDEDTPTTFSVDAFDFDGDPLQIVDVSVTGTGTISDTGLSAPVVTGNYTGTAFSLTFDPSGAYDYLPSGESTTETVSVTVSDGAGGETTISSIVTIIGVDDPPAIISGDDSGVVIEDTLTVVNGTLFAEDPDGPDVFTWSVVGGGAGLYGTMSVNTTGTWTYALDNTNADVQALNLGDTLAESFDIMIDDGLGGTDSRTVDITIEGLNDDGSANPLLQTFETGVSGGPGGFVFSGSWSAVDALQTDGRDENPYSPALNSGSFVVSNGGGDVSIARDAPFDLQSAVLTSPFEASVDIEVFGFVEDGSDPDPDPDPTGSQVITLTMGEGTLINFDDAVFDAVQSVVFESGGAFFGMDDLLLIG